MYELDIENPDRQTNEIFPQVTSMGLDYDFNGPHSITHISANEPLTFTPDLKSFSLDPDTNLTDIITQGYIYTDGLLVSQRLFDVIKNHLLPSHEVYPARVIHLNEAFAYCWIHFTERPVSRIDFERTEFVEIDEHGLSTPTRFAGPGELHARCKAVVETISGRLSAKELVFLPDTPGYDLLFLDVVPRVILISDLMADLLNAGRFTGLRIKRSTIRVTSP
jgi:hypothetical protein